jgi:hypothetical protein
MQAREDTARFQWTAQRSLPPAKRLNLKRFIASVEREQKFSLLD